MTEITCRVRITGRVQGVGFRAWTREAALSRGVTGWVRNRPGGAVEALLHGPEAHVGAVLQDLRRGPAFARVDLVEHRPAPDVRPEGFEIRR
ncbi:acylphosphatase [Oceanicola sp. S124]|uniref:acylphosphatase n=1 Tax=Oceanicola sp. S124 TaxID=1042378 RepID=UPI0002EF7BC5|nr:acylphosphatase [Oceanicola sp. S124]